MHTVERGTVVGLSTRGSATIRDKDNNIVGAIVCGHDLSSPKYVDYIKEYTGSEVTIFEGDTRLMTSLTDEKGDRVIGTKASEAVINTVLVRGRHSHSLLHYSDMIITRITRRLLPTKGSLGCFFPGYPSIKPWQDKERW